MSRWWWAVRSRCMQERAKDNELTYEDQGFNTIPPLRCRNSGLSMHATKGIGGPDGYREEGRRKRDQPRFSSAIAGQTSPITSK